MRVAILTPGRTGSMTFFKACEHITNYSCSHEGSVAGAPAIVRATIPENHIAVDPRLVWMLGLLEQVNPEDDILYVKMLRNPVDCARSWAKRSGTVRNTLIDAYRDSILQDGPTDQPENLAMDMLATIDANVNEFLSWRSNFMLFHLEDARADFRCFWAKIGAEGDLGAALAEWEVRHNAS